MSRSPEVTDEAWTEDEVMQIEASGRGYRPVGERVEAVASPNGPVAPGKRS